MRAVVFRGIGDMRFDTVADPSVEDPTGTAARLACSATRGTDLHTVRGTSPGMAPGTVLGHGGLGIVEEAGRGVRRLGRGDRAVVRGAHRAIAADGREDRLERARMPGAKTADLDTAEPVAVPPHVGPTPDATEACKRFDLRRPGRIESEPRPGR